MSLAENQPAGPVAASFPARSSHLIDQPSTSRDPPSIPDVVISNENSVLRVSDGDFKQNRITEQTTGVDTLSNSGDVEVQTVGNSTGQTVWSHRQRVHSLPVLSNNQNRIVSQASEDVGNTTLPISGLLTPSKSQSELSYNTQTSSDDEYSKHYDMTVMLQRDDVMNVPHTVHCVKVMHQVYLIIICEVSNGFQFINDNS